MHVDLHAMTVSNPGIVSITSKFDGRYANLYERVWRNHGSATLWNQELLPMQKREQEFSFWTV